MSASLAGAKQNGVEKRSVKSCSRFSFGISVLFQKFDLVVGEGWHRAGVGVWRKPGNRPANRPSGAWNRFDFVA